MRAWWAATIALLAPAFLVTSSCNDDASSSPDASTALGSTLDAGAHVDASKPPPSSTGQSIPPVVCDQAAITSSDVPTFVASNPAFGAGSCTSSDVLALEASIVGEVTTASDWYDAVSPSCQKCAFSGENDANWQVLVFTPSLAQALASSTTSPQGFVNVGPCFQEGPSGSAACAKGAFDYQECIALECPVSCGESCVTEATNTGNCVSSFAEATTGCGGNLASLSTYCGVNLAGPYDYPTLIANLVQAVCVGGSDAGVVSGDGSAD